MLFSPGDHVHVAALGKAVVREVRNRGRYLIELKGRTLVVAESQLTAAKAAKRVKAMNETAAPATVTAPRRTNAPTTLDLHGMTTAEAVHALDEFVNQALLGSVDEVRIIHGRSGGRLRAAAHARLRELPSVRAFRIDPRNAGVTVVTF